MNELRAAFEAFHAYRKPSKGAVKRETMFARLPDDSYVDDSVQRHWWTWQNAAAPSPAAPVVPQWQPVLRSLAANAAALRAFEAEVRAVIGNTNWAAIAEYVRQADELLAAIAPAGNGQAGGAESAAWAIVYDDTDRHHEIVFGEAAARARFARISDQWNAHLFVKVTSNSRDDRHANDNITLGPPPAGRTLTDAYILAEFHRLQHEDSEWAMTFDLHDFTAGARFAERFHGLAASTTNQAGGAG